MTLLGNHHFNLTRGPHGNVVTLTIALFLLAAGALFVAVAYEPLRIPLFAFAILCGLALFALAITMLARLRAKLNDVHYAISLESGLRQAGYVVSDLFTDEAAANPSLQLFNFKVLRTCQPQAILELGSGQTTKLLSCYARDTPSAYVLTLEQDRAWLERLKKNIDHDYRYVPLVRKEFACAGSGLRLSTWWYEDVTELKARRFDYILVDGPYTGTVGTEHTDYARSGLLQYMPSILAESFVIVFDDAERYGEVMTINALQGILRASQVPFVCFAIHGIKRQVVLCSPDKAFLQSV